MGGLLSAIKNSQLLEGLWFMDGSNLWDWAMSMIGQLLWGFVDLIFIAIELIEKVFRAFAGISGKVTTASGEPIEGDLVLYFINSDLVQDIFLSVLVLSVVLLIIFTIFAIVKNQYSEKQEPVKKIIGNSFKALLMYLMVPVATIVCLLVGNIVLQAIDSVTKPSSASDGAGLLFVSATYSANKLRGDSPDDALWYFHDSLTFDVKQEMERACSGLDVDDKSTYDSADWAELADILDEAYVTGRLGTDKWTYSQVQKYYYAGSISFITLFVGGFFMGLSLFRIAFGVVNRLFKMVLYYALSPAVLATYPIQGDKVLQGWRGEMVKNGTSAYTAVAMLNVLYSVLPFFENINLGIASVGVGMNNLAIGNLFGATTMLVAGGLVSRLVSLFIYIIAYMSVGDIIGTISGWFGTGNALADGIKAQGQVKGGIEAAKKTLEKPGAFTGKVINTGSAMKAGWDRAGKMQGNKFMGAMQGLYSQTEFGKARNKQREERAAAIKAGEAQYDQHRKSNYLGLGLENKDKAEQYAGRDILGKEKAKLEILLADYADPSKSPAERKAILNKIKSQSSLAREVVKDAEEQVEVADLQNKEKSEVASAFVQLKKNGEDIVSLAEKIFGRTVDEDDIQALRDGDIDAAVMGMPTDAKDRIKKQWDLLGTQFASTDMEFANTQKTITELVANDTRVKNLVTVRGLQDYDKLELGKTGGNWDMFAASIEAELSEIRSNAEDIRQQRRQIDSDIISAAGRSVANGATDKELQNIGKNSGK